MTLMCWAESVHGPPRMVVACVYVHVEVYWAAWSIHLPPTPVVLRACDRRPACFGWVVAQRCVHIHHCYWS